MPTTPHSDAWDDSSFQMPRANQPRLLLKFFPLLIAMAVAPLASGQITRAENLTLILGGTSTAPSTPSSPRTFEANPGPWGNLQCAYVFLEAPGHLLESFALPSPTPRWTFPEDSLPALPEFFAKAGLPQQMIETLLSPKRIVRQENLVHLMPPLQDLEAITPETRAIIYTELAKYPENEYQADPVLIAGASVEEWYATSSMRPEIIAKIKKLSYMRGETTVFSDIPVLLNYAQSDSEARAIFKGCTRTRSILVRLKLNKHSNAEEIINYWTLGVGLRRKDIEPLINSIIETDGLEDLGLSHLLPPLARKLLYTFPGLELAKHGALPDCHWTSLNFFNYEPHEYLLDARLATSQVLEQFTAVDPPYQYGDILFFLDNATGDAFHSCVHLADDLVYTKNGRNILSPWVIMKVEDVKKVYLFRGNGRVQGFRRKDIFEEKKAKTSE